MVKVVSKFLMVLAVSAAFAACGGSSGSGRTGTGGGGGGAGGSAGSGGADAGTDAPAFMPNWHCDTMGIEPTSTAATATSMLITDFAMGTGWSNSSGKWMTPGGNLTGSKYGYGDNNHPLTTTSSSTVTVTNEALTVTGNVDVGSYGGFGMSFDQCVNTTMWNAVQFTLGGDAAGCSMLFQLKTFEQQGASNGGGCTAASCYGFPQVPVTIGTDPIVVTFASLENTGTPTMAVDFAKEIIGFQWQFQSPAADPDGGTQVGCTGINVTVDNVMWLHQ
jgi:hypothetical protein